MMIKVAATAFVLFAACSFAQEPPRAEQAAKRPGDVVQYFPPAPRPQATVVAEARVQDMETLGKLTTEGQGLYDADLQKRTGYQYCSIAFGLSSRGEFRLAVREASKALFLGRTQGNDDLIAHAKRDLSMAYSYAGNLERAQQYAEEALTHRVNEQNRASVHSWAYKVLGDVAMRRGDTPKAISMYEKSFGMNGGDTRFFARASLASAYIAAGDLSKATAAIKDTESYLEVLTSSRSGAEAALARIKGNLALKQGEPEQARSFFSKAVEQSTGVDQAYQRFWALDGQARAQLLQGDKVSALNSYVAAIAISEQVRARFHSEEINTGVFGEMQHPFDETVRLAMESGQTEVAWQASERGRSRALLDLVRNRVQLASETNVFIDPVGEATKLADFQALLKPDDVLVEYHMLPTRTYVWVVRKTKIDSATLEIKRDEVTKLIEALRDAISQPKADPAKHSMKLYDVLLRPLGLNDGESIAIVPHSVLHYVPFQALHDGDAYLIEKFALSYAPSASTLAAVLRGGVPKSGKLFALANPDLGKTDYALPGAQREVEAIKILFADSEAYFQKDATKVRFLASAPKANLVHVAAHADVDALDPLYSRIYLASTGKDDGTLEAHEVYRMNLKGSGLVVLSACESALGRVSTGDEIWGFTRSFLSAGAPALLVSLWPVADESTERLITRFYQALGKNNARTALRQAQLEVMREPKFSHPFFWAPFDLVGDWR
jgi:CHAT domain-containing protein